MTEWTAAFIVVLAAIPLGFWLIHAMARAEKVERGFMNKRVKKLWVKALRSGKYKQGEGCLRHKQRYCCLGVLCEVYRKTHKASRWKGGTFMGESFCLSDAVVKWAGLRERNPVFPYMQESAASLNDNRWPFDKIAAEIEQQP